MGFAFGPVNGRTAVSSFIVLPSSLDRGARGKRATRQTAAPTRRKKTAQGKEISGRPQGHALGHESQNKSSPEGAKDADALPKGWRRVAVKDMADSIQYGHTASAIERKGGPRFLRITDIQDGRFDWSAVPSCEIPKEDIPKYRLSSGDLVFARTGATTGKSFLIGDCPEAVFASYLIRVRVSAHVESRYLAAFFQSPDYWRQIEGGKRSIGQPNLNGKVLGEAQFPIAPLPEQRRIVAEIEKQFTRLEAGVAALRRVQANLKRYRASGLKAACEGKLVPTEAELTAKNAKSAKTKPDSLPASSAFSAVKNPTYETGAALLVRILTERRKHWERSAGSGVPAYKGKLVESVGRVPSRGVRGRGKYKEPAIPDTANLPPLPEGWTWARLEQLGLTFGGLTKNPKRAKLPKQLPYLRVVNVYANELRLEEIEHIGVDDSELEKLLLRTGDLLIVEGNGSKGQIGRLAIWDGSIDPCVHQNHIIKVRPVEALVSKWILHWLQSPNGRHFVELVASSTSGLYTLSVNKVGALPIALPSLAEQRRIVAEVERRLSVLEELEAVVSADLQRASRLRRSILQKAFTGKLVDEEPAKKN